MYVEKFSDRFSRFDTIPECDGHPATQPARHVAVAITLNAKASSLKITKFSIFRENSKFQSQVSTETPSFISSNLQIIM